MIGKNGGRKVMISVIIPTYNTALLIERTIRSVLNQSVHDFEILVVDDCSTDNTLEVVERINDARIRIFRQMKNQGPAAARNRGLREAKGEYCAFLDGDDYWEADFLKETSSFLDTHSEAVAVSVMQCHKIIGKAPMIAPRDTGITSPIVLDDFFAFWAKFNHVCTGSVLMRTAIAQQTGGQREDLRVCEDLEFWALLATFGKWGFIPKVLFTSDGGSVTQKQGWLAKNKKRWASAVPSTEWEKRFAERITPAMQNGYNKAKGRISRNLCYSMLLSGRIALTRQEVLLNGKYFSANRINRIFRKMAKCRICWFMFCKMLYLREVLRAL